MTKTFQNLVADDFDGDFTDQVSRFEFLDDITGGHTKFWRESVHKRNYNAQSVRRRLLLEYLVLKSEYHRRVIECFFAVTHFAPGTFICPNHLQTPCSTLKIVDTREHTFTRRLTLKNS